MQTETWTPERVEQLKTFIVNGLSCSQIAAQIGVSRNAVIGKIHRLGLSPGRPAGAPARSCPPRARHPRVSGRPSPLRLLFSQGAPVEQVAGPALVESVKPCSLLDLAANNCRWPIGEAANEAGAGALTFCGNEAIGGLSYCAGHARMAYRETARRRA